MSARSLTGATLADARSLGGQERGPVKPSGVYGSKKQFYSSAELRIGKLDSGNYKLYVVGGVRNETGRFWIVAGSGARVPAWKEYATQKPRGYSTKEELIAFGRELFPTRGSYKDFIAEPMGSAPLDTAAWELQDDVVELWDSA